MLTPPAAVHALLFAASGPLTKEHLGELLNLDQKELALVLNATAALLKGSGETLIETADEVELRTSFEAAPIVKKLRESELSRDVGKASMETLAVIAYSTPTSKVGAPTGSVGDGATRGEVDWVRGVNSSASLRTLLMRGLIEGREDPTDKRRIRYTLTTEALAHLGITSVKDLPRAEELHAGAAAIIEHEKADAATFPDPE
ncbi:MAG: SMC-Scp complex subunit ScpB [Patescibacteria group bacterium]|mgnify:CR=1 FL=1